MLAKRIGNQSNSKKVDIESRVDLDLEMSEKSADHSSRNAAHGSKTNSKYKPVDPVIELPHVRARELEHLMKIGQQRAEVSLMGAGFLGGASNIMIFTWIVFGFGWGGATLFYATSFHTDSPSVHISSMLPLAWGLVTSWLRAILLFRKMYRRAYFSFIIMMAIWATLVLITTLITIVDLSMDQSKFVLTLCGVAPSYHCSGFNLMVAQRIYVIGYLILAIACFFAISISFNLAEGRFKAASDALILICVLLGFMLLCCGIAYAIVDFMASSIRLFVFTFGIFFIAAVLMQRRQSVRNAADSKIKIDRDQYDKIWLELTADKDTAAQLLKLSSTLKHIEASKPEENIFSEEPEDQEENGDPEDLENQKYPEEPHLREKITASSKKMLREISADFNMTKPRQAIGDLVTLYAQAYAINENFQKCVTGWSDGIEGAIPNKAGVKKQSRAIEKLHRSYTGDASKLIDLVRSSIKFETVSSLIEAVERISADPKVAILQVKNRLNKNYDGRASAGYRNVSLSLIVVDEHTIKAGCQLHVCELQLGLKEIDKIKNDKGHKKYVQWRNLNAE